MPTVASLDCYGGTGSESTSWWVRGAAACDSYYRNLFSGSEPGIASCVLTAITISQAAQAPALRFKFVIVLWNLAYPLDPGSGSLLHFYSRHHV